MEPYKYLTIIGIIIGILLILMAVTAADAATIQGLQHDRERAIFALGYVQEPRNYLYWHGTKQGLAKGEISRLDTILFCESKWIATAQNSSSSAAGLGQVTRATWLAYSDYPWSERYNPHRNIQTVIKIYQARGTQPWAQCL